MTGTALTLAGLGTQVGTQAAQRSKESDVRISSEAAVASAVAAVVDG